MKVFVKVKPKAKSEGVEKLSDNVFKVSVKAVPEKGKANVAVIKTLADYFGLNHSKIKIVSGLTSKTKIVEIYEKQ